MPEGRQEYHEIESKGTCDQEHSAQPATPVDGAPTTKLCLRRVISSAEDKWSPSSQMRPTTASGNPTWPRSCPMGDPALNEWGNDFTIENMQIFCW